MISRLTLAIRKPTRIARLALLALALVILCSPGLTAGAQSTEAGSTSGISNKTNGVTRHQPEATCPAGGQCFADVPAGNSFYEFINRIYMQDLVSGYPCGGVGEPCDADNRPYYRPGGTVTRQQMAKFIDNARRQPGIYIETSTDANPLRSSTSADGGVGVYGSGTSGYGVWGESNGGGGVSGQSTTGYGVYGYTQGSFNVAGVYGESTNSLGYGVWGKANGGPDAIGVYGQSDDGRGVLGQSYSGYGVYGDSGSSYGVWGYSTDNNGVVGTTNSNSAWGVLGDGTGNGGGGVAGFSSSNTGVYGSSDTGWAGWFQGNVNVTGTCCGAGAGTYRIDHPTDPENKYLVQSAVQGADMMSIYNGNVTTDAKGEAVVALPAYIEALNKEFRYQLTVMGQFAQAIVAEEIKDKRFTIRTDKPNVKVSWQVTGIRHDPYAQAHRLSVEEEKPAEERGKYLHPAEWGQPEAAGIDYEERQKVQEEMQEEMRQAGER